MSGAQQRGFALIAAVFLLVVVAVLGLFALRIGMLREQTASLQLADRRALAAAHAGLEYWSNRAYNNPALACTAPAAPVLLDLQSFAPSAGFDGYRVTVSCARIMSGTEAVYEVVADAWTGSFGSADFVRRRLTRRISGIGSGSW